MNKLMAPVSGYKPDKPAATVLGYVFLFSNDKYINQQNITLAKRIKRNSDTMNRKL